MGERGDNIISSMGYIKYLNHVVNGAINPTYVFIISIS
jgi:hypothetical protein